MSLMTASLSSVVSGELHGVGLKTCVGEVIVQGDESPVCGVATGGSLSRSHRQS